MPTLAFNVKSNLLRADPTRTLMIRRKFVGDLTRRFKRLKTALVGFLVTHDALGLKTFTTRMVTMQQDREFQFLTDPQKLDAFNRWFAQQVAADIFSVPEGTDPTRPWTAQYVESAYKRGLLNAYFSAKAADLFGAVEVGDLSSQQFLRDSFLQPETLNKVRLLATRVFEDLKGVTSIMGSQMNRILAQGMIDGTGPLELANLMSKTIDGLTNQRALVIARTEVINAHAEGQLDSFKKLGVEELGVKAEFSTAGDDRVCPICEGMEGKLYNVDEAHGIIPVHPNCRCTWIPFVPP